MAKDAHEFVANVADAELKLLVVLWDRGRSTAREITELTYGQAAAGPIGTALRKLPRCKSCCNGWKPKGWSVATGRARAWLRGHDFARRVCRQPTGTDGRRLTEGSLVPFLTHLVEATKLSKQERDQIRPLLEEFPSKKKPGERK